MLSKPYEFVYNVGYSNHYYLDLGDMPYKFLTIESYEQLERKRLFRKPLVKEVSTSIKMLPLNVVVLFLISNAKNLNVMTYKLDVNDEKIDIYETWDEFDVSDLKKSFNHLLKDFKETNYSTPYAVKNAVAKGYVKEGFMFFCLEKNGNYARTYWLIRTTELGYLHFIAVNEVGTEASPRTATVDSVILDKPMLDIINNDFGKGYFMPNLGEEKENE